MASLEDQKWTPLKIARFSGAKEDVLAVLEKGIDGNESSPSGEEYERKRGHQQTGYCDYCECVSSIYFPAPRHHTHIASRICLIPDFC